MSEEARRIHAYLSAYPHERNINLIAAAVGCSTSAVMQVVARLRSEQGGDAPGAAGSGGSGSSPNTLRRR